VNENFGDFTTGYVQWLVKAKNLDVACTQDVPLKLTASENDE
jgi:hypothetical protein